MSNAKYRNHQPYPAASNSAETRAASAVPDAPSVQALLEHAKRVLGLMLNETEASLAKADGKITTRDALNVTRQVIAIARIEQRAAERAAREAAAAQQPPITVTKPAPSPTMHEKAAAFAAATADNPTDPVPILLPAPPPDVRDAG